MTQLLTEATDLLKQLIATRSVSGDEGATADLIQQYLEAKGVPVKRQLNNVWAMNTAFEPDRPTLLLNSHHDTVKPNSDYSRDPFQPTVEDGKVFGLGSNDAGGALVSLISTFLYFYEQQNLNYNLVLAATAEEEISGDKGISAIWDQLPEIDSAIVGEPTQMRMAVAEKGLMVLDCTANGKSGHAARGEGNNAIYTAMDDIAWIKNHQFEKISNFLGPIKMTTTIIKSGSKHNVVPNSCLFTVDVRTTDAHSNEETLDIIKQHLKSEVTPRSTRLNPSSIPPDHPLVQAGQKLGITTFGSPTLSDQALMPVPSLKMGPGKSARSHTDNEFICLSEIEEGINGYITLLKQVVH
ncbi:M20 family metallo-hydrolase [Fodinibius halophilus]|uniref:M20 family metallo-hydrolase n=1 Tax=Fodinibius halophilus TaxID=1736908 RepID=A0A6M1SWF6_9BACT|nr:M20 family metallo-hydrolase [Fodinibius halophilus]NGP88198.1 M20 family metallo-hydrolase [Fodinibius halophilus]